ncbi:MAG: pilus assembly protein TadG-related protein [Nocardioidaceae bacterium]
MTGRRRRTRRTFDESGQITAMLVMFCICLLLAVVAVTDVSAGYLRRQGAASLADGAALAATDAAAAGSVYGEVDDAYVTLDPAAATAAVEHYLRVTGAYADYRGLKAAVRVDGHTVTVSLVVPFELPVPVPGVPRSTVVHGTSSAVMPIY